MSKFRPARRRRCCGAPPIATGVITSSSKPDRDLRLSLNQVLPRTLGSPFLPPLSSGRYDWCSAWHVIRSLVSQKGKPGTNFASATKVDASPCFAAHPVAQRCLPAHDNQSAGRFVVGPREDVDGYYFPSEALRLGSASHIDVDHATFHSGARVGDAINPGIAAGSRDADPGAEGQDRGIGGDGPSMRRPAGGCEAGDRGRGRGEAARAVGDSQAEQGNDSYERKAHTTDGAIVSPLYPFILIRGRCRIRASGTPRRRSSLPAPLAACPAS